MFNSISFNRGLLLLIFAQMMVGINIVSAKLLIFDIPILVLMALRFGLATVALLPLHWLSQAKKTPLRQHLSRLNRKDWIYLTAQALTAGVLFNFLMLWGLHYTDANVAGVITSALPAMIAVMSWIILKENISFKKMLCILSATLGLGIIAFSKLHGISSAHSFKGDVIILVALIPEAAYYVFCQLHPNRLPIFLTSAIINAMNAIVLIPFLFVEPIGQISFNLFTILILIILGLSSGLFYVFWFLGCQRVDGTMASLTTALMPISTVLFAWLILHEYFNFSQFIGMGFVLLSIIIYARK